MSEDMVKRAKELAYRAHAGQVDKAGRPYIEHVARVAASVSDDPESETVAWLHDVVEDCPEVVLHYRWFPRVVFDALDAVTRGEDEDDWYYFWIRINPLALRVKLADISDNSSEERLALLDDKTASRLRRKYAKAVAALTGDR